MVKVCVLEYFAVVGCNNSVAYLHRALASGNMLFLVAALPQTTVSRGRRQVAIVGGDVFDDALNFRDLNWELKVVGVRVLW